MSILRTKYPALAFLENFIMPGLGFQLVLNGVDSLNDFYLIMNRALKASENTSDIFGISGRGLDLL